MKKIFIKNIIGVTAFLVVTILITSSSTSLTLSSLSDTKNSDSKIIEEEKNGLIGDLTGLDPNRHVNNPVSNAPFTVNHDIKANSVIKSVTDIYGFIAYSGSSGEPEGPCYCPIDDPGNITSLGTWMGANFIAGGTWTCDEVWFGCEYNTGCLWRIDPEDGETEQIGGSGTSCNGLAWDPVYNRLYGTSGTALYEYDPETGEQEYIGSHGVDNTMIALAIARNGNAYMWDVLFSGNSHLFSVDLETGEATEYADMGENLCYAQDGCFDWETGKLFLTAYSSYGFLAYWDNNAQELKHIGNFEGNT